MKKLLGDIYRKVLDFKNNTLPIFFIASPFLAGLYYLLFSSKFRREQHSVIKGKVTHLKQLRVDKQNIYTLIRNTHRLEKGLLMRPRRAVFARDYIGETVDAFLNIWSPHRIAQDAQYKWFYDVLNEYFETSGPDKTVDFYAKKFFDFLDGFPSLEQNLSTDVKSIPYTRLQEMKPEISYDDFFRLNRYRRSVRWFLKKEVPRNLVDKAILAANQAPSACNRQPYQYRIIDDSDLLAKVAALPGGVRGYEKGIPMMIVVVGNLDAYFDERDRHVIYIDASLANMVFMLALETLGLSSCSINWPDVEHLEKGMETTLNLEKHQRPIMCMAVGYPDPTGKVAFSEKRSLEHLRTYN